MSGLGIEMTVTAHMELAELYKELIQLREQFDRLLEKTELTVSVETSSAKEKERQPLNEQELHCIARHMKEFVEAAIHEKVADLAKPCKACLYRTMCKLDWNKAIKKLSNKTGVHVDFHYYGT